MASRKAPAAATKSSFEVREVSEDKRKGRGVFASRDFKYGDVIMFETDAVLAQEQYVDPPLPFLVCEHCLAYIGSLETQLEILASDLEVDPIPSVRHKNHFFSFRRDDFPESTLMFESQEWFDKFKKQEPKLPSYKSCDDCGAAFCETKCFDLAQRLYHRRLCPKLLQSDESDECMALQKFWELDSQTPVRRKKLKN